MRDASRKAVSKLLMKSIGERDYSAQETCHLIMGDKLVTASREFKTLHLENKQDIDLSARSSKASATVLIRWRTCDCLFARLLAMAAPVG